MCGINVLLKFQRIVELIYFGLPELYLIYIFIIYSEIISNFYNFCFTQSITIIKRLCILEMYFLTCFVNWLRRPLLDAGVTLAMVACVSC